jgi:hypothetical protein
MSSSQSQTSSATLAAVAGLVVTVCAGCVVAFLRPSASSGSKKADAPASEVSRHARKAQVAVLGWLQ